MHHRFEVDDDLWEAWTAGLPGSTTPDERLRELLAADAEGRLEVGDRPRGIPEMNTETQTAPIDPSAVEEKRD